MPKENQRVALSKRLLKEGLIELLKKKNIGDISVKELCEISGINRTTFYRHYQTPRDVLSEIELEFARRAQEKPLPSTDLSDVKKYADYFCGFLFENREMLKLLMQNSDDASISLIYQDYFDFALGSRKILYKGRSVGPDILRLMNTFFAYGVCAVLRQWILEDMPLTPEEVADLLAGSFNQDLTIQ